MAGHKLNLLHKYYSIEVIHYILAVPLSGNLNAHNLSSSMAAVVQDQCCISMCFFQFIFKKPDLQIWETEVVGTQNMQS